MKKLRLRGKLVLGSLVMIVLVMLVSALIVSMVITRQNKEASYEQIRKALNIIEEDLGAKLDKLRADAKQASVTGEMGGKLQFVGDYKENDESNISESVYQEITGLLFQIAKTGDLWRLSIFDREGDLLSFCAKNDQGDAAVGYATYGQGRRTFHYNLVEGDGGLASEERKSSEAPPIETLKTRIDGEMPTETSIGYENVDRTLCLTAYVPILANVFNQETNAPEKKQVGCVRAAMNLGNAFASKMTSLTGAQINLFVSGAYSAGVVKDYDVLNARGSRPLNADDGNAVGAQKVGISLNELTLGGQGYFQGILPVYAGTKRVGELTALYSKKTAKENTRQMIQLLGLVYIGCILLILPVAMLFSGSLSKPIIRIIGKLRETAATVFSTAAQVSSASQQLADGASTQASSLEETSSSLEELSSMTGKNAEHAKEADRLTKQGIQHLKDANVAMKSLIRSMEETSTASGNVESIIKTIDEIAFQTNLLALNAAVEAARAGEAGAGFAVVADEVRTLALRSAEASKNTQELVREIIKKIREGSTLVNETDEKYRAVALNIQEVTKLVEEIAVASDEQSKGIQEVNTALGHIDEITQHNSASAEESASASKELHGQAETMQGVTDDLADIVGTAGQRTALKKRRARDSKGGGSASPKRSVRFDDASSGKKSGALAPGKTPLALPAMKELEGFSDF